MKARFSARLSKLKLLKTALERAGEIACIVEALGAKAFLAGGAAEGRLTASSDIDIVILLPHEPSFEEAVELRAKLFEEIEKRNIPDYLPFELHIVGPKELKKYRKLIPLKCLAQHALRAEGGEGVAYVG